MGSYFLGELVRDLLRGRLDGGVARRIAAHGDRTAGQRGEPAAPDPADEARHERRAGEARHHHGRSEEPRLPPEERDRDTVASEVTIDQQRDEAVLRERPPDLRGVSSDWRTSRVSTPSRSRIRCRIRFTSDWPPASRRW